MPKVSQAQKEATKRYEDKAYDKALIRMPSFYGGLLICHVQHRKH